MSDRKVPIPLLKGIEDLQEEKVVSKEEIEELLKEKKN